MSPAHAVAVAGSVTVDVMMPVEALPALGRLEHASTLQLGVGGVPGNCGGVLGKLGVPTFAVARVGDDVFGELIVREIGADADVRFVTVDASRPTSATVVLSTPEGERSFVYSAGANAGFDVAAFDVAALAALGVGHVHVGYATLLPSLCGAHLASVLQQARSLGMTTSIDVTWDPTGRWWEALEGVLPHVDVFAPNHAEATAITGCDDPLQAAQSLLAAGVRAAVAVTLDADGCVVAGADGSVLRVASPSVSLIDATGAGDAFLAGWIAARAHRYDLEAAVDVAVAVGAEAVTARRAVDGVKPRVW